MGKPADDTLSAGNADDDESLDGAWTTYVILLVIIYARVGRIRRQWRLQGNRRSRTMAVATERRQEMRRERRVLLAVTGSVEDKRSTCDGGSQIGKSSVGRSVDACSDSLNVKLLGSPHVSARPTTW